MISRAQRMFGKIIFGSIFIFFFNLTASGEQIVFSEEQLEMMEVSSFLISEFSPLPEVRKNIEFGYCNLHGAFASFVMNNLQFNGATDQEIKDLISSGYWSQYNVWFLSGVVDDVIRDARTRRIGSSIETKLAATRTFGEAMKRLCLSALDLPSDR